MNRGDTRYGQLKEISEELNNDERIGDDGLLALIQNLLDHVIAIEEQQEEDAKTIKWLRERVDALNANTWNSI